uniref:Peptidase M28 domain-containing protein n=1 Tax=Panagrolaimus sp. ES5 TaxID=591445 RepID=A0AC34FYF9_9BILA
MNRRRNVPSSSTKSDSQEQQIYTSINAKPKHASSQLSPLHWLAFICIIIGLFIFAHLCHIHLPKPLEPNYDNSQFSEIRATPILHKLSNLGPKPFGSSGADRAVEMLQDEVRALKKIVDKGKNKLDIEMQYPSSCFSVPKFDVDGFGMCYKNVSNLIVRLTPKEKLPTKTKEEGALLLNCHFDSWPTSPAGSDDLASCAILLELIQILGDPNAEPLKHDLIFLFNGAEEAGLLASHGFITQHNERHRIKGFVNLEASGSGGREILFQSGPFSQWMLDAYLNAAPYPHCSVIGQEVFQSGIVPSDTDFRIFRDHGKISGLDFAFAQNAYWWHTEFDEARRITKGSIQRAGENVLATLRYLLAQDSFAAANNTKASIFVFFDFLGITTVSYSYVTAWIFNLIAAVAVFITIKRRKTDFETYKSVAKSNYLTQLGISFIIYLGIYALIGIFMKFFIAFIGEHFGAKLLWLTKHSAVFPLMVVPVAYLAFAGFSFIINYSND